MPFGLARPSRIDHSLLLAREGYLFTAQLADEERRELADTGALTISLLGRQALLVTGDAGVRLFYDEGRVQRRRAVPAPIGLSLFGPGAVHALDDDAHRHRKSMFRDALTQADVERLLEVAERRWRSELESWTEAGSGEVYAAAVDVFGASVIEWAGIREPEEQAREHARWLARIVDGFGVPGPAYVRAAGARRRCDRWASELVRDERAHQSADPDSWLARVAAFVDHDGNPLPERVAAVELLNILRPTVAAAWLASFATIALVEHPHWRNRIREEAEQASGGAGRIATAFAHEVRRYYPFVPVLAARARRDFRFAGHVVRKGQRVLLDVYGTNHGSEWEDPWSFEPARFLEADPCTITHYVPQGGGPVDSGHRCPGEGVSNGLVALTVSLLACIDGLDLTPQDRHFSMRRMPTRPASGTRVSVGGSPSARGCPVGSQPGS